MGAGRRFGNLRGPPSHHLGDSFQAGPLRMPVQRFGFDTQSPWLRLRKTAPWRGGPRPTPPWVLAGAPLLARLLALATPVGGVLALTPFPSRAFYSLKHVPLSAVDLPNFESAPKGAASPDVHRQIEVGSWLGRFESRRCPRLSLLVIHMHSCTVVSQELVDKARADRSPASLSLL